MCGGIECRVKLSLNVPPWYRVKRGQTISTIAKTFRLPPRLLAACNGLEGEAEEGQVLSVPAVEGNLYVVRGGESKALLCGSEEAFEQKNKTACLYIGQTVLL